jgi:peptidoglycan L-alanyl-D-glutamate endopeptidase CwlK
MNKFSDKSLSILQTVHPDLQTLFHSVLEDWDCTVVSGLRTEDEQQELYAKGRTADGDIVTYLDGIVKKSKHQTGDAVDVIPYPSGYSDLATMDKFGLFVLDRAIELKREGKIDSVIKWGGHWRWKDRPHFERDE